MNRVNCFRERLETHLLIKNFISIKKEMKHDKSVTASTSVKAAAAFLFIVGCILFFFSSGGIYNAGVTLFVIGSILFFISAIMELRLIK